jgi:hypothetical protein
MAGEFSRHFGSSCRRADPAYSRTLLLVLSEDQLVPADFGAGACCRGSSAWLARRTWADARQSSFSDREAKLTGCSTPVQEERPEESPVLVRRDRKCVTEWAFGFIGAGQERPALGAWRIVVFGVVRPCRSEVAQPGVGGPDATTEAHARCAVHPRKNPLRNETSGPATHGTPAPTDVHGPAPEHFPAGRQAASVHAADLPSLRAVDDPHRRDVRKGSCSCGDSWNYYCPVHGTSR